MAEKDEFGALLVGFVIGGLTGAVAALLMAPQSGEDTRRIIKDKAIELSDRVSTTVEDAYAKAEASAVEARARFDELAKMTHEKGEAMQNKGKVLVEKQPPQGAESEPIENI